MGGSILLLDSNRTVRGGQTVFLQLAAVARTLFDRVTLMFPTGGDLEFKARLQAGPETTLVSIPELDLTRRRKGVWDLLKLGLFTLAFVRHFPRVARHDVIYVNSGRLFVPLLFTAFFFPGKRFIYHLHHDHNALEKRLIRFMAERGNTFRVIANSHFAWERLVAAQPALAGNPRLMVVENALSMEYAALPFEDRFSGGEGGLKVAVIGGIGPEKGQDWVVDLAPGLPDVTFYLIGGVEPGCGEYVAGLQARSPGNVVWAGESRNLPATLREHGVQLSLMPSRCLEAFGLVAIESMACSCLTLTSGMGGLRHIAEKTGAWTFHDRAGLEAMLRELLATPREALAEQARQQHARTAEHYHQDLFRRRIGGVLAAAAL